MQGDLPLSYPAICWSNHELQQWVNMRNNWADSKEQANLWVWGWIIQRINHIEGPPGTSE